MAKLPVLQPMSKAQPDIINILHDEVISLCQQKYSAVSGLEIDGIICISILDTKEQQVVKIHKTLKSVFSDTIVSTTKKRTNYPRIAGILSSRGPAEVPAPKVPVQIPSNSHGVSPLNITPADETLDFKNDINKLSELLKASDEANYVNQVVGGSINDDEPVAKKSKRKRKQPKRAASAQEKNLALVEAATDSPNEVWNGNATFGDIPEAVDKVFTVKEEPCDLEYQTAAQTQPKIVSVQSISHMDEKSDVVDKESRKPSESVSHLIEKLIDKEIQSRTDPTGSPLYTKDGGVENASVQKTGDLDMMKADNVKVKQENTAVDSEYGVEEKNQNLEADGEIKMNREHNQNIEGSIAQQNSEECNYQGIENLVSDAKNKKNIFDMEKHLILGNGSLGEENSGSDSGQGSNPNEAIKMALLEKYYEKGSIAHEGYPHERPRQVQDPLGRSWIDMVKDNVNKYQAALMRTVTKVKGGSSPSCVQTRTGRSGTTASTRGLLQNANHLKSLLKEAPGTLNLGSASGTEDSDPWRGPGPRARSLPGNVHGSSSDRSQSTSPAPVVKIEVDEDTSHEMYLKDGVSEPTELKSKDTQQNPTKQGGRKLESRYPALFNQLQQARGASGSSQPDSLVDRLPFISFQELFSQTSTSTAEGGSGVTVPRMSDSVTMQLLAKAKMNPYPSKEPDPNKKRSVWKWKKRHVKPKDDSGQVLSHLPAPPKEQHTELKSLLSPSLGINMSAKKTFSKKRRKGDDDDDDYDDEDYKPYSDSRVRRGMENTYRVKEKTRTGSGEKPRMDFTEVDQIDSDIDDMSEMEQSEPPMQLVSAYCKNNCGHKFVSFAELQIHEEECMCVASKSGKDKPEISVETIAAAKGRSIPREAETNSEELERNLPESNALSASGNNNFKCNLCGLDFNQQYRWHYHMVKVHGVSADDMGLFR